LFWVELGTAVLFVFLYGHYGLGWELAFAALFCCLFISLLLIDLERSILPNKLIYTGIVVALVVAGAGSIFGFEPVDIVGGGFELWIVDAAIGGGVGFLILLLPGLLYRGGMGWGDIKLAALIGFVTGFPLVLLAIFFAVIVGALTAAVLLILRRKGRKDPIPFGPFLSVAAIATMFWGNDIFNLLIRALITKCNGQSYFSMTEHPQ
jgi:leader peptidase (prepilin peptidase)/N-methyltransferase